MTDKRFDWDLNGIWDYQSDSDEYLESSKEICELLNELHEESEEMQKKMNRLYNYFEDFFSDEMGNDDFAEQWEFVADDEKWD